MKRHLHWVFLVPVSVFFAVAAMGKIPDPATFARDIVNYRLVPFDVAYLSALWMPWLELFAAIGLLIRASRRDSALILLGLLMVFQVALASAWLRGLDINCGCLGSTAETGVELAFLRNLALIGCLVVAHFLHHRPARG